MIPSERIYLLPYYNRFLQTGPVGKGVIVSPLDAIGEWLLRGIVFRTEKGDWTIVAMRTPTRQTLITLLERQELAKPERLRRALLTTNAPEAVVTAAEKLGIATFRFQTEPKQLEVPCSLCGTRIKPDHFPWRCKECPNQFGSEYRIVICHRCASPFRTSPRLERETLSLIADPAVWDTTTSCPDCRRAQLQSPVLAFDGTVRNLILYGLLRGKLKMEHLAEMGAPADYVSEVIRPAFMKLSTMGRQAAVAKSLEMEPPKQLVGDETKVEEVISIDSGSKSMVEIATTIDSVLSDSSVAAPVNELLEAEISALEQASRTGIVRNHYESAQDYLKRIGSTPPQLVPPRPALVLDAMDADLVEASRVLPEFDLDSLLKAGADISSKVAEKLNTAQKRGEDLLTFIGRMKEMIR